MRLKPVFRLLDTIGVTFNASDSSNSNYVFSENGIAWPGEAKKYASAPGYSDLSQIVPPPAWQARFPNGYSSDNVPNLHTDEHFQNWMRVAGLPTFTKLYGRNDQDTLKAGVYQLSVTYSTFHIPPYCFLWVFLTCCRGRLPCSPIWWHESHCYLDCVLDGWKESFPRLGLRCCSRRLCPSRRRRTCSSSR